MGQSDIKQNTSKRMGIMKENNEFPQRKCGGRSNSYWVIKEEDDYPSSSSLMGHHWGSSLRWPISVMGHWERVLKDEKEPARHKVGKEQLTQGKNRAQRMYLGRGGIWIGSWRMGEVSVDTEIRPIMGPSTSLLILGKFFSSPGLNFFFYEIKRFKWMIPMEELRW